MNQDRPPLIVTGQIYLNEALNEYIIVTKNNRGQISYAGNGFMGRQIDEDFIDAFPPVDPEDVSPEELNMLISFCPSGTVPRVGFIKE